MSIVITGNPGVGKHTITQEIAEKLKLDIVDVNAVAKDSGLFEENDDSNDIDVEKLGNILKQKISEENVIVGHLAPYALRKNQVKIMIVLRRSPYDLIPVYKKREYSDEKIKENTGSEILGIITHDAISKFQEKVFQINVSGKTIPETVQKVIEMITGKVGNEEVDWLELVRKNNDLGKFFVD
jgi:adenylate kinase